MLDTLLAVGSSHLDTLPILDGRLPVFDTVTHCQPLAAPVTTNQRRRRVCHTWRNHSMTYLPEFSCNGSEGSRVKPAVGGKKKAGVKEQPLVVEPINGLPLLPGVSCNGSDVKPAVGRKEQAGVSDQPPVVESIDDLPLLPGFSCDGSEGRPPVVESIDDLPLLPGFSCDGSEGRHVKPAFGGKEITDLPSLPEGSGMEPAVGGKRKRRLDKNKLPGALASPSIPWRRLPYLRWEAMADIRVVADIYGKDLLDVSPGTSFLDLSQARALLDTILDSLWRHCLDKQGNLKPDTVDDSIHFLEIFSGCGHLTLSAARNGLRVGPSIDKLPGIGHAPGFSIDIRKPADRKIVWALVAVLNPLWIHMGFPCTFWVAIAHWTRQRDLERNEESRLEALVYIMFSRQLVYYQASRRRHSSIENPPGSVAWDLDIVQDMVHAGKMQCVQTNVCAWGSKDPVSGRFYHKLLKIACTFNIMSSMRNCPGDHAHEHVQGTIREGHFKGRTRSALSGRYPLSMCDAWASAARQQISHS